MSKITFEEFCQSKGVVAEMPEITGVSDKVKKQMLASYIWEFIVETLNNEGLDKPWEPDYSNDDEDKWELWLDFSPSSGWSLNDVAYWRTHTRCGSRRVFRTDKIAREAGENLLHFFTDTF